MNTSLMKIAYFQVGYENGLQYMSFHNIKYDNIKSKKKFFFLYFSHFASSMRRERLNKIYHMIHRWIENFV